MSRSVSLNGPFAFKKADVFCCCLSDSFCVSVVSLAIGLSPIDGFGRVAKTLKNHSVCVTGQDILTNVIMYRVRDAVSRDACGEGRL